MSKIDYNEEPVYYCTECLSLKIRSIDNMPDSGYCDNCGSTDISSIDIANWERRYKHKYGKSFITKNKE